MFQGGPFPEYFVGHGQVTVKQASVSDDALSPWAGGSWESVSHYVVSLETEVGKRATIQEMKIAQDNLDPDQQHSNSLQSYSC